MARVAGVELPRNKRMEIALTYIYGIGHARALEILGKANDAAGASPANPGGYLAMMKILTVMGFIGLRGRFARHVLSVNLWRLRNPEKQKPATRRGFTIGSDSFGAGR